MKKLLVIIALGVFGWFPALAQQDVMVSQYMFNGLFLNPAYSGTHPYFSSSLLYRTQWVRFDGAPVTQLLSMDGPIAKDKMGVGFIFSHDKIGVTEETDFFANYSYKLKLGPGKLSFGVKGGASVYRASLTDLVYWDKSDEVFSGNLNSSFMPKFGFGAYYYTERYYAGFAVPTLLAYDKNYDFSLDLEKSSYMRRHYFINGGYVFDMGESFKLKPSFLVKYQPAAPVQLDFNISTRYKDMIWFGASFRTGDAATVLLEYQANQRFRIGYAFDYTVSGMRKYSNGTHEIMLGYDIGKDVVKMKTPRFF